MTQMSAAKNKSLTQRMYLNSFASLLNYITTTVVVFIVSPLLLSFLGQTLFGIWRFCQNSLGYVSSADGRTTQALKWVIANKQSSDDSDSKQRDIGSAIIIWFFFLPFLLIVGSAVSWFLPHLINDLPREHFMMVRLTGALLVLNIIIQPLQSVPEAVLIGTNQAHKCMWIRSVAAILSGVFMVGFAYIGWGTAGVACGLLLATTIRGILILGKARKDISWFGVKRPHKGEARDFYKFSFWSFCWSFINRLMLSGDILILGLAISVEKVASYSLSQYAMTASLGITGMIVGAATPGLGGIVGANDFKRAGRVRSEIMTGSWLMIVVSGSMILLWNRSFVGLWVGQKIFVGFTENMVMVLSLFQLVFIRNEAFIINLTLKIRNKVFLGSLSVGLSLILAYAFSQLFSSSVVGVVVGLMAGRFILTVSYPLMVNRAFKINGRKQVTALFRPALATIVLFFTAIYLSMHFQVISWVYLVLYGVISFVLLLGIAFFLGLSRKQRGNIFVRLGDLPFNRFFSSQ